MKLLSLPESLKDRYDHDSLVYSSGDLYYNSGVSKELISDIILKELFIYTGWYEYRDKWECPKIYLVGRGKRSGKCLIKIENFYPYCWDVNGYYRKPLKKDQAEKVLFKGMPPMKVAELRRFAEKKRKPIPYEADIPFVRRFLIDMYPNFKPNEMPDLKIAIVDVETNYPESEDVISFAINDLSSSTIYVNTIDLSDNIYDLILDLYKHIYQADVFTSWNVKFDVSHIENHLEFIQYSFEPFDLKETWNIDEYIKYIVDDKRYYDLDTAEAVLNALIKHGFLIKEGDNLRVSELIFKPTLSKLFGIVDTIQVTKKIIKKELPSWSLANAGRELVGILKHHLPSIRPRDLDNEELINYNAIDVLIPEEIEHLYAPITYHIILAWLLQTQLEDTVITSVYNDIAIITEYNKNGYILPSKNITREKRGYSAAEPYGKQGVYKNILAFDLSSAYPSIVLGLNATIETKDPNGKLIAANNIRFNDSYSPFTDALKRLIEERKKIKAKMKDTTDSIELQKLDLLQRALKTQAAAFSHGIFGYKRSRLFDEEVAGAITSTARDIINRSRDLLEKRNHEVIYAHTDSLYFVGEKEKMKELLDTLNSFLESYAKNKNMISVPRFEPKETGYFPKGYVHSPARNILVDENGKWHITGMNIIRVDAPEVIKEIEKKLISMKLEDRSNKEILIWLKNKINKLKSTDPRKLGIVKPLNKSIRNYGWTGKDGKKVGTPYHVKALLNAKEDYGFSVEPGDKFMILPVKKLKSKDEPGWIAFSIDDNLPDGYDIDYDTYLENNLYNKICGMFDMDEKELKEVLNV